MPDARSPRVLLILALGVISFTFAPILVRWANDAPGLAIAAWRNILAVALLAPVALVKIGDEVRSFDRRDTILIASAGLFLGLHFITWIESLYHTTVASASVLVTTSPIFLAALGYVVLGERLAWRTLAGVGVAVSGAILIGWGDAAAGANVPVLGDGALWGNSLALSASLLVSVYLLIGRVVRQKVSWLAYVFPLYAVSALTTLVAAWAAGVPLMGYDASFYALCGAMALGPQVIGHGAFNYGVQFLPATVVGMLALLEPVGASALAYVFFSEVPPLIAIAGMLVVLAGVALVIWTRRAKKESA
ncbi:EamA family transporter [Longibacter salinarum]|uniref:EamA family transporter n=1 Tax=Longibacter salinarum TaxID=1850348 RepID=A0A2A8CWB3_9BACT|nr:DMT family transporter [Longibacter salinarum]PEN12884.1 EamA family transporter [Longibacter salinarum]